MIVPFDYQPLGRVVFGAGSLSRIGKLARELGGRRILLVTDPGIVAAGHIERALQFLAGSDIRAEVFDSIQENPTTRHAVACADAARAFGADLFVAVGGGSAMDAAKGGNFLLTGGGKMQDYWGIGKAKGPMLPFLAVPTTAGTGSEAQSFALIADEVTHQKMACGDKRCAAKIALLDPEVTLSQPHAVTAISGMDAVAHALESHVTVSRNEVSRMFSERAWRLLSAGFPKVLANGADLEARGQMLLGAHLAGAAIECSMLGATHAMANPLTTRFGITHGVAIGVLLPQVLRFNEPAVAADYRALDEDIVQTVTRLRASAGLPRSLAELDVPRDAIPALAEEAAEQWTARHNPRPLAVRDFVRLYEYAYDA